MYLEFFKFELRFQLRQPLLWICALILAAMAFAASSSDAVQMGGAIGNVNRNAPMVIAQFLGSFTVLSMFIVTIFIAGAVLRDSEIGISDMIFATPMRKHDYLIGRFAAGLVACLLIFILIAIGLMLGPLMPWVDTARVGPFSIAPYIWGFLVFVIPNLLFIGALLMLLAATTRSIMLVYVGIIGFFILWTMAGIFSREISNEWVATMMDPFGIRAFSRITRYYSPAEANATLPSFSGFLLFNRLLWSTVGFGLFGATLAFFKPQRQGTGKRWFGKAKTKISTETVPQVFKVSAVTPVINSLTNWSQLKAIYLFDTKSVIRSVPFLVMLLFGVANLTGTASMYGEIFGTSLYPVTANMLKAMSNSFDFLLILIITFYAGEIIFKERQVKIADVIDAMPIPNWAPLLAKCLSLCTVILIFLCFGMLTTMLIQLIKGGVEFEFLLYCKGLLISAVPYVLLGMLAIALQVFTNNKFIGYLLMILVLISQLVMGFLQLDHNLYNFAGLPSLPYSDMNGYGHFLRGWSWFAVYWSLFTVAMLIAAQAFWVRGLSHEWRTRVRIASDNLKSTAGVAMAFFLLCFTCTGGWIFYNTNILNHYESKDAVMDKQASYEKLFRQYKDLPHPKVTDVSANVDIFPQQRRVEIHGRYVLQNKTSSPLDTLRLQVMPELETQWENLPAHQVVLENKLHGFSIIRLQQPLAPGATLALNFNVTVKNPGFTNSGTPDTINLNGTFFNNMGFFPHFGYNSGVELLDRNERRKRGLIEPERMAKLENQAARANTLFGAEADWINFETTISTSDDQIAMAPGYLQKSWEKDGRRYFHYKMDKPMMPFFAYLSARWEVKKADWKGIPIEIYYDKKHTYNIDHMITSTQKSLDYLTAEFSPYQHQQVRILEFPNYQRFAQSFANTIPYSEAFGFITDLRNKEDLDYIFYVTAHEMSHQWWGHQVIGAELQGSSMLMESLAQYSAMMIMEKQFGREKMRKYLRYELDRYLSERGGEVIEELPLYRVENQQYIHYRKGSLIFYRLRDEISEAALNRALKRYIQDKAFQTAPYTTTQELLSYIRAEAKPEQQALITDLFEKIVFYDNRVTEAKAKQRPDGQWDVTMQVHLAKKEADGKGKETARAYDEAIEIGIFARAPGAKESAEKILFSEKRKLPDGDSSLTITLKEKPFEAGVDPYNKMIDKVSKDNRKEISIE